MKLGSLNIIGHCSKTEQLQVFVNDHELDVLSGNETWLDEYINIYDNEIEIPGYTIGRRGRHRNGGGVCFYTGDSIAFYVSEQYTDLQNQVSSIMTIC